MRTHLGRFFTKLREERGLRPGQLALQIGYRDGASGGAKIAKFEQEAEGPIDLLQKLIAFYQLDPQKVRDLIEMDHQDYIKRVNAWLDEPIEPHLVVRWMAAVYSTRKLPPEITTLEDAIEFGRQAFKTEPLRCVLVWTRRLSVFFNPDHPDGHPLHSTPEKVHLVYTSIGGKPFLWGSDLQSIVGVQLPPKELNESLKKLSNDPENGDAKSPTEPKE